YRKRLHRPASVRHAHPAVLVIHIQFLMELIACQLLLRRTDRPCGFRVHKYPDRARPGNTVSLSVLHDKVAVAEKSFESVRPGIYPDMLSQLRITLHVDLPALEYPRPFRLFQMGHAKPHCLRMKDRAVLEII